MAINSLRPNWAKIKYISLGRTHTMTIPIRLGTWDGVFNGAVELNCWDGIGRQDDVAITQFVNVLRVFHSVASDFIQFETWQQLSAGVPPVLMSQRPLAIAGTAAGASFGFSQMTLTFKTAAGGRMNIRQMEMAGSGFGVTASLYQNLNDPTGLNANIIALRDYILSDVHPFTGRDNARPILALNVAHKINDTLRKRAMRLGEVS